MAEHPSSLCPSSTWVPFPCLRGSHPLMRTTDHSSREWVFLPCLRRSIHWREQLTIYLGSESLSCVGADHIRWQEWLNIHPACESLSWVWADHIHWQERLIIHPACESLSCVWADHIHWQLNIHLGCESLSCFWVDHIHRTNDHPSREWVPILCLRRSVHNH